MFTRNKDPEKALSRGVILTISATGSEMNGNAVISNMKEKEKLAIQSPVLVPNFSILDPTATYTLPEEQTVYGIVDIASHIFEQYFKSYKNTLIPDRFAESLLITLKEASKKVLKDPNNYEARSNIMLAATLALNGGVYANKDVNYSYLVSMGKDTGFVVHPIEHELSAFYDIPHGGGLAILYPNWMKYVLEAGVDKFAQYACRVFNIKSENKTKKEIAVEGINRTRQWFNDIGAPSSLSDYDIGEEKFEVMAKRLTESGPINSYIDLEKEDIINIFNMSK